MTKIIKFKTPTCKPCKDFAPIFEELKGEYPNIEFIVNDITVDPSNARKYNVRGAPTFVALNDNEEVIGLLTNAQTKASFEKWMKEAGL